MDIQPTSALDIEIRVGMTSGLLSLEGNQIHFEVAGQGVCRSSFCTMALLTAAVSMINLNSSPKITPRSVTIVTDMVHPNLRESHIQKSTP